MLGTCAWFGYSLPLPERLRLIRAAGFDTISLWLGPEEGFVSAGREGEMPALARSSGLSIDNVHAPFGDCNFLWSGEENKRRAIGEQYLKGIAYCARHEIPRLVIHVTSGASHPAPGQAGMDTLAGLLSAAEKEGVVLALENTRRPEYLDRIFADLSSASLRFCYDSSHDLLYGAPPYAILKRWGALACVTHLCDNGGRIDDHWLPGEGLNDWDAICSGLALAGYSGTIFLEAVPKSPAETPPADFLKRAFEKACELQRMILRLQRP